jgi:hypothetical protein
MRNRRIVIVIVTLAALSFLAVAVAASPAKVNYDAQDTGSYLTYLPLIISHCDDLTVSAYATVDRPVIKVGDTFTVTLAIVDEGCAYVSGIDDASATVDPLGITSPTSQHDYTPPPRALAPGEYTEYQFVFQAVGDGIASIGTSGSFEYGGEYRARRGNAVTSITIRFLP